MELRLTLALKGRGKELLQDEMMEESQVGELEDAKDRNSLVSPLLPADMRHAIEEQLNMEDNGAGVFGALKHIKRNMKPLEDAAAATTDASSSQGQEGGKTSSEGSTSIGKAELLQDLLNGGLFNDNLALKTDEELAKILEALEVRSYFSGIN